MTIHNENVMEHKYFYLDLIEWKDMICRMCLIGMKQDEGEDSIAAADKPIHAKVEYFLSEVWDWFYEKELWSRDDREIRFVSLDNPPD